MFWMFGGRMHCNGHYTPRTNWKHKLNKKSRMSVLNFKLSYIAQYSVALIEYALNKYDSECMKNVKDCYTLQCPSTNDSFVLSHLEIASETIYRSDEVHDIIKELPEDNISLYPIADRNFRTNKFLNTLIKVTRQSRTLILLKFVNKWAYFWTSVFSERCFVKILLSSYLRPVGSRIFLLTSNISNWGSHNVPQGLKIIELSFNERRRTSYIPNFFVNNYWLCCKQQDSQN